MVDFDKHISFSVLRLFLMFVAVVGNSLFLFVILKNQKLRGTSANLLLAQLCVANFILGISAGTRGISTLIFQSYDMTIFPRWLCLVLGSPTVLGIHLSQTTMVAIALDRFLCVQFPVAYRQMETTFIALSRLFICLGYSVLGTGASYLGVPFNDDDRVQVCSTSAVITAWYSNYWFFFASIFTVFIYVAYISIYVLFTRRASGDISATQRALFGTMTAVLVSYFLLWCLPNLLSAIFKLIAVPTVVKQLVSALTGLCSNITAATNIFIYGWKHPEMRKYVKRAFVGGQSTAVTPVAAVTKPSSSQF
uniref:G_PROTEIN_RECEP_F1_2 domain-containing protein n=1 Tax=Steinernema glaseri TaxID=37863 RepID=A0A1I7ZVH3_9BILA